MATQKSTTTTAKKQDKPLTPKQAVAKANNLLKGIDNSSVAIKKHQAAIEASVEQVKVLVDGIGNQPAPTPKAVKAPTAKPAAKASTEKSTATTKTAKPVTKTAKPAQAKKAAVAKAPKEAKTNEDSGPTIKEAAIAVLRKEGKAMKAADIWHVAQQTYSRTWSRQVLYNALNKNTEIFVRDGDEFGLSQKANVVAVTNGKKDDDADDFVERVSKNETVSTVM